MIGSGIGLFLQTRPYQETSLAEGKGVELYLRIGIINFTDTNWDFSEYLTEGPRTADDNPWQTVPCARNPFDWQYLQF